tara:strand:- start:464 stop:1348 length:885 start_codon:yes stop_codon:yes gene_type:complete
MTGTDATWVTQFLGEELTAEENRLETAACEIIPCGLEKTVSYGSGTAAGPAAIISASHQLERLIGEDEACRHGLYTHPALDCSTTIAEVLHNVQKQVFACIARAHIPVTLGGEHSLTYGAVKGLQDGLEQPFGIVQIDAHADLRTAYQGEPHSHASVMHLCCSEDIPLFQLGVRALCREEVEARRRYNVGYCDADRLVRQQLSSVTLPDDFPELVYVSFDLDGLDPAVLPATGTPVPGGLGFYQALDLVSSACSGRKIVGLDIVELAPSPAHPASNFTAALVTYHLIALALSQR